MLITAERPIVQKDLTSTTSSVSGDEIASLPLEDVASVVNLQAGVVDGHFRGGRSNEVKYLIDGVAVNDVFSGGYTMQAEVNSIAEVQVLSGTFNAEYGEAMSGIVNQVTKIAGERYTGEVSGYTRWLHEQPDGPVRRSRSKEIPRIPSRSLFKGVQRPGEPERSASGAARDCSASSRQDDI